MPYSLNWSVNVGAQIDAQPYGVSKSSNIVISSSNAIQQSSLLTGSGWTPLSLGQCQNVVGISIWNDNTIYSASVVLLATGSAGGNLISVIQPGQAAAIPWSGSLGGLYASAIAGQTASIQSYFQQA
jgi:hypothetical protein